MQIYSTVSEDSRYIYTDIWWVDPTM